MKVRCIGKSIEDLPKTYFDVRKRLGEGPFPLTIGRTYVVYAVETQGARVEYYVHDDDDSSYPIWYAAPLFEIVDPAPSEQWVCAYFPPSDNAEGSFVLAFPEWASNRFFYNNLIDEQGEAMAAYSRYRALIEGEVPI